MKILFITKHNPFGIGGGSFASHAYLKAFSEISDGNIDICIADHVKITNELIFNNVYYIKKRNIVSRLISLFTGHMHRYTAFVKKLLSTNYDYDYCVFDHSSIAGTLVNYVNKFNITLNPQ
jgi:hypothetical protein